MGNYTRIRGLFYEVIIFSMIRYVCASPVNANNASDSDRRYMMYNFKKSLNHMTKVSHDKRAPYIAPSLIGWDYARPYLLRYVEGRGSWIQEMP